MSLVNWLYQNVEDVFAWLSLVVKQDALAYCDLETADSKNVLVSKDGSLISIIKLDGYKRFVGPNEFSYLCQRLTEMLQPVFSSNGHYLQFFFSYDKSGIKKTIDDALIPAKKTAKRLSLKIDDIFDSRVDTLSQYCANEECYIVLWSTPQCLSKAHLKQVLNHEKEKRKNINVKLSRKMQNLFTVLPEIRNMHNSFVDTILEDIQHAGFYAEILEVHEALCEIRKTIDKKFTDDAWSPYLPGDKLPLRTKKFGKPELSDIAWPALDAQLIPRDGENINLKVARIGDTIYAPIFIDLFPKDIKPFYELFRRMLSSDLPWRISFFVAPDGIKITQSKNLLAQFLTFSSHYNRLIVDSHKMLKAMHERSDNPIVSLQVCLSTWAKVGQDDLLKERAAKLAKAVQSWGGCDVREVSGDAYGTTLASALSVTSQINMTASAAPLSDAVFMFPFVRPASPWQQGALLFRTPDGKLWPYQPGSNQQVSWIDIIYARSGSGKSVLLNTVNLALCLSSGLANLPRISIIDIGPSSKGFISLIREGLPKEKQHEALYYRLTMEEKDAINPFDTQLGSRFPTRMHRSFLINFLSLMLVDNIEDSLYEGMTSMLSMIVDELYKRFSEKEQPKIYVQHLDAEIDEAIKDLKFEMPIGKRTWWQIADKLFEVGNRKLSLKAQRYAMPVLPDTISISHTHSIKDLFAEVKTPTGEDYVTSYCRIISGVIRNFPTLTCVTKLNFEDSRIVALDLDEVAKSGSVAAEKQTAMMYMLGRHILAQHYFLHAEEVEKFPSIYREFHKSRIKEIMEEPKRMVFDEFHRTSKSPVVREQILQDMREGRKWKIHIALSSQSLKDFDELMIEFATSIFILDSGSTMSINETCKVFGLTETEKLALSTRVHGPTSKGANFVAQFVTKQGMNTQLLTSTISPVELWAFNTTTEDVLIRDALYKQIGPLSTRKLLAQQFPKGSATSDIEAELKADATITISEICNKIIADMVELHKKQKHRRNFENLAEGLL